MIPDEVELADEYETVEDIAEAVIEKSAEAQDVSKDGLDTIIINAIDEAEMPLAIENSDEISQESWDRMRYLIKREVQAKGYRVD